MKSQAIFENRRGGVGPSLGGEWLFGVHAFMVKIHFRAASQAAQRHIFPFASHSSSHCVPVKSQSCPSKRAMRKDGILSTFSPSVEVSHLLINLSNGLLIYVSVFNIACTSPINSLSISIIPIYAPINFLVRADGNPPDVKMP